MGSLSNPANPSSATPSAARARHAKAHATGKGVPIHHRRARFDFSAVPRHWLGGDVFLTRFIDALSIHFPDGERFFMDSVRNYEKRVTDPQLREDIRLFIRQEAQHGNAHEQYNDMIQSQGVNAARWVRLLKAEARFAQKKLPKKVQLALTAAAEHLTATLGEGILEVMPELLENSHPEMRALYFWHATEEVEHKAVAFDTYYSAANGDYATRTVSMVVFTLWLHYKLAVVMNEMLKADGQRTLGVIVPGIMKLYGPRGFLSRIAPRYLAWFKPGFHPFDTNLPSIAKTWIAEYEKDQDLHRATRIALAEVPAVRAA
jgi:predicted metal-dependent hydrolase